MIPSIQEQPMRRLKFFIKRTSRRFKMKRDYGRSDMFDFINLEINSQCNRKCSYCPNAFYKREAKNVLLPIATIEKLLKELKSIKYSGGISFSNYNEPLLDNRIYDIIKLTRKYLPDATIAMATNGDLLSPAKEFELKKAGANIINVSPHYDPKYAQTPFNNRCGLVKPINVDYYPRCLYDDGLSLVVINYKGDVVICCNDFLNKMTLGNIKEKSLKEIWYDPRYVAIRKSLEKKIFNHTICKICVGEEKLKK